MSTQSSHHNTVEDLVARFNEVRSLGNLPTPSVCCHSAEGGFCLRTTALMLPCPVRGRSVSYFTPRGCCCSYITIWNCWCFWRKGTWWLLAVVAHSFVKCTVIQNGRLVWLCTPICVTYIEWKIEKNTSLIFLLMIVQWWCCQKWLKSAAQYDKTVNG